MISSIKVDTRFKGTWHYEEYLIEKHKKEIGLFLFEMNYPIELKKLIRELYDIYVDKENIVRVYTHPPNEFIVHLCYGTFHELENYTSTRKFQKVRKEYVNETNASGNEGRAS